MLLIAAPGQGAQAPGFLSPWLELPGFADRLAAWSPLAGCDLIRCGSTADAAETRDTAVVQPLLLAAAIAAAEVLAEDAPAKVGTANVGTANVGTANVGTANVGTANVGTANVGTANVGTGNVGTAKVGTGKVGTGNGPRQPGRLTGQPGAAAGHSVGELAAGVIAGTITAEDAIRLVRVRGRAMAEASAAEPTGMTAVLGGDQAAVLAAIEAHGLTPANVNGAGQIVAAGTLGQLAAFAADPPAGARLRSLSVAGAFHTAHMAPAVAALREAAAGLRIADPALALLSNRDGQVVRTGTDWLERIITQVAAPVRWDKCLQTMTDLGVTALIELPPAGPLTGLARRADLGLQLIAVKTPGDLDQARRLMAEHADSHTDSHAPEWRLLVAPQPGTFRACPGQAESAAPGAVIGSGAELGHVEMRGGSHLVAPTFPATIIEWLVEDGDPVSAGQPLVRLEPDAAR